MPAACSIQGCLASEWIKLDMLEVLEAEGSPFIQEPLKTYSGGPFCWRVFCHQRKKTSEEFFVVFFFFFNLVNAELTDGRITKRFKPGTTIFVTRVKMISRII